MVKNIKFYFITTLLMLFSMGAWSTDAVFNFNSSAGLSALGIAEPSKGTGTDLNASTDYISGDVIMNVTHGGTNTRVWKSDSKTPVLDLRVYKTTGSLTFSVSASYKITGISMTGSDLGNFSANVGTYSSGTWTAPSTTTTSVTFTSASGTSKPKVITVTYTATSVTHVSSVLLNETEIELEVGSSQTLTETVLPSDAADKSITWESTNPSVATVYNGVVTGVTPGIDTIVVHTNDGDKTDTCIVTVTPFSGECYDFSQIEGFRYWGSSYKEHTVDYYRDIVIFSSADKQLGTITDIPVTLGSDIYVHTNRGTILGCFLECRQWLTKEQTITLYYSTDDGTTFTSIGSPSSTFSIANNSLPEGTNALKFTFSSSENQIGIAQLCLKHSDEPCVEYNVTYVNKPSGTTNTVSYCEGKCFLPSPSTFESNGYEWEFYGWGTNENTYGEILNGSFTLTKDTVLYAIYQLSGKDYVLVENDLGSNWTGDYLIAYSPTIFADGRIGGDSGIGANGSKVNPSTNLTGKVVNGAWGDTYNIELEEVSTGSSTYLLKTKDGKYNYRTNNSTGGSISASENKSTASSYPITITFNSSSDIKIGLGGSAEGQSLQYNTSSSGLFRYYKNGNQNPIYLYRKECIRNINPNNILPIEWSTDYIKFDILDGDSIIIKSVDGGDELFKEEISKMLVEDGSYKANINNVNALSCSELRIIVKKAGNNDYVNLLKVPIFISESNTTNSGMSHKSGTDSITCDIVVLADSKLTLTGNLENRDVTIYSNGVLNIPNSYTYTVNSLTLRRDNDSVPHLSYNGTMDIKNGLFFEMRTDGSDWRWLTLPDTFRTKDVNANSKTGGVYDYGVLIKHYDGQYRADNGRGGWKLTEPDSAFAPGIGCIFGLYTDNDAKQIHRIELDTAILKNEKSNKSVQVYAYTSNTGKPDNDLGWNVVGNPYFDIYHAGLSNPIKVGHLIKDNSTTPWNGKWIIDEDDVESELRYIVIKSEETEDEIAAGGYKSICITTDGYDLKPFTSFFIQASGDALLTFDKSNKVSRAPSRQSINDINETFLRVKVGDRQTGCFISNKFTDEYEIGDDLESMYPIYQLINGYKLLYSAVNDSIINNGITVYTPSGALRLDEKVNTNDFEEIYALYDGGWYDLLHGETVDVSDSFILYARRKENNNVATDISNVTNNVTTRKVIYQGNLYIIKNNCIFNALGEKIIRQ